MTESGSHGWNAQRAGGVFGPLPPGAHQVFSLLAEALKRIRPLNAAQRRSLPEDAAALSRLLTVERAELRRPYWATPAFVSAYLYYFLPWNLLRLARLLAALPLPAPAASGESLLLDVGSGPLTLPLALWLARPELEDAPLHVLALDSAPQPLDLGKALFKILGEMTGRRIWPIRTERRPLGQAARRPLFMSGSGLPHTWLVTAANVLNECGGRAARREAPGREAYENDAYENDEDTGLPESADDCGPGADLLRLFLQLRGRQGGAPALLVVEPGTRLGGKTMMTLRNTAQARGLAAIAPCPHHAACPLLRGRGRTWCHFTFDCAGAPGWLERLSVEAGLAKSSLSLAYLLLHGEAAESAQAVRVLSAPFAVPGLAGKCRYACSKQGLLLLEDAEGAAQGDMLRLRPDIKGRRDAKSGALIVRAGGAESAPPKRRATS